MGIQDDIRAGGDAYRNEQARKEAQLAELERARKAQEEEAERRAQLAAELRLTIDRFLQQARTRGLEPESSNFLDVNGWHLGNADVSDGYVGLFLDVTGQIWVQHCRISDHEFPGHRSRWCRWDVGGANEQLWREPGLRNTGYIEDFSREESRIPFHLGHAAARLGLEI